MGGYCRREILGGERGERARKKDLGERGRHYGQMDIVGRGRKENLQGMRETGERDLVETKKLHGEGEREGRIGEESTM